MTNTQEEILKQIKDDLTDGRKLLPEEVFLNVEIWQTVSLTASVNRSSCRHPFTITFNTTANTNIWRAAHSHQSAWTDSRPEDNRTSGSHLHNMNGHKIHYNSAYTVELLTYKQLNLHLHTFNICTLNTSSTYTGSTQHTLTH